MLLKYSTPGLKAWQGKRLDLGNFRAHPSSFTIMELSTFFRDKPAHKIKLYQYL